MRMRVIAVNTSVIVLVLIMCGICFSADMQKARDLAHSGQYSAAIPIFENILTSTDKDSAPPALLALGFCYKNTANYSKALDCYQTLKAKYPNSADDKDIRLSIAECYMGSGDTEKAMLESEALSKDYPDCALKLHSTLGNLCMSQKKYTEAISEFDKYLEVCKVLNDDNVKDIRSKLMICYLMNNDWEKGLSQQSLLLKDYPTDSAKWHYLVGCRYTWHSEYSKALSELEQAQKDSVNYPVKATIKEIHISLADTYQALKNWTKALEQLQVLLHDYPGGTPQWHYKMALCYQNMNDSSNARDEFKKAIDSIDNSSKPPWFKDAKARLLECYINLQDWGSAKSLVRELIRDYPDNEARWLTMLGWICVDTREYDIAVATAKDVIERYPGKDEAITAQVILATATFNHGKNRDEALAFQKEYYHKRQDRQAEYLLVFAKTMFYTMEDYTEAATAFEKYISEYPNDPLIPGIKRQLAESFNLSGQVEKAAQVFKDILKYAPESKKADLVRRIANIYFEGKKYREAIGVFKEALRFPDWKPDIKAEIIYKLGFCYSKINYRDSSRRYMKIVIERWPDSNWAKKAKGAIYVWNNYGTASIIDN